MRRGKDSEENVRGEEIPRVLCFRAKTCSLQFFAPCRCLHRRSHFLIPYLRTGDKCTSVAGPRNLLFSPS